MAWANSNLSEVEMVMIYQAKSHYEYTSKSKTGTLDWSEILEMAGVSYVSEHAAEQWVRHNYVLHRFHGTEGCIEWLKSNARLSNGDLSRSRLSTELFKPIERNDEFMDANATEEYQEDLRILIGQAGRHTFLANSLLTGIRNPSETHLELYRRVNGARSFWVRTCSCLSDFTEFVADDETLAAYLVKYKIEYEGSLQQLRLDLISIWGASSSWKGLKYPDEDQNHAVFIFYRLVDWFSEGVMFDCSPNKKLFDDLVKRAHESGNLGTRRTMSEWCTWFVRELVENPNGCQYFNANGRTLTRIRFELLRLGRESGWWGNPQMKTFYEMSMYGLGTSGMVRLGMLPLRR